MTGTEFDFLHGQWKVRHRRLQTRLKGADDWQEFDGRVLVWSTLGGIGNVVDNELDLPEGTYRAMSVRSFDPETREWAIWWLDGRSPHMMDVPVVGGFVEGEGQFLADDQLMEGRSRSGSDGRIRERKHHFGSRHSQQMAERAGE